METKIVYGIDLTGANAALFAALAKAQGTMASAKKGSENPHFRSKYADLSSVLEAILPAMNAQGLALLQFPGDDEGPRVALTTLITHSEGGWLASQASCKADKDTAQGYGSAVSYLKRYSAQSAMACPSDADDDGNAASGARKSPAKPAPSTASAPAERPPANTSQNDGGAVEGASPPVSTSYDSRDCPDCGSPMWDNRFDKRNPRGPDYKCKDKECGKAVWLPKPSGSAPAGSDTNEIPF